MNNLYRHVTLGTTVTLVNERANWVEFYDPSQPFLRYLEADVFHSHYAHLSPHVLREQARANHILVPKELDS